MAEVNPCFVLTTQTHNSEILRNMVRVLRMGSGVGTSTDLAVSAPGGMNIAVAFGRAVVDGTESALQGSYTLYNDASVTKAIAAADPTNPRRDLVCARVLDQDYSGASRLWQLAVITGTPGVSPALPATPANAIPLADVAVAAAAGSIIAGNITDIRPIIGLGNDATKLQALALVAAIGTRVDVARLDHAHPATGITRKLDDQSGSGVASLTLTIPAGTYRTLTIDFTGRSDQAGGQVLNMQLNGDAGNNYDSSYFVIANVTQTNVAPSIAAAQGIIGGIGPTGAAAGMVGALRIVIENADSATLRKGWIFQGGRFDSDAAAGYIFVSGQGQWRNTSAAITSILIKAPTGNLVNARAILRGETY